MSATPHDLMQGAFDPAGDPAVPAPRFNFFSGLQAEITAPDAPLRAAITAAYRKDERAAVIDLLRSIERDPARDAAAHALARDLVVAVRGERRRGAGVDALMHEFSLSSHEGVALMCLAEALLRIPDAATADRLIADKIGHGDWQRHLGASSSLFVNASAWGLLITGKLVATRSERGLSSALAKLVAKGGEPLIRKAMHAAMRLLGDKFVTGQTIDEALANSEANQARGYTYSYDMLGEAALTDDDARRYTDAYQAAIHAIGRAARGVGIRPGPGISVKLSALHPRYNRLQRQSVIDELLPRLKNLACLARHYGIGINIDAEEADRLELSLDLLEWLAFDPDLAGFDGIGFVVQAYQKRCPYVIDYLADLARRSGRRFMVRLVKGAYWDAEIKRAQVDGLPGYPVYTRKVHTDVSYLACAQKLLQSADLLYPQFATHNAQTVAAIYTAARAYGVSDYEFQCLHGMGETLYDQVLGQDRLGGRCRIYAPVGPHATLLAYLVRRLLENGANSSFVNQIVDERIAVDALIADPVAVAAQHGGAPHPKIPLPPALFGPARVNSSGLDLSDEQQLREVAQALAQYGSASWHAAPIVDGNSPAAASASIPARAVRNPADDRDLPGQVIESSWSDVDAALQAAAAFAPTWQAMNAAERAVILVRAASLLERQRDELIALAVREAGKSIPNAVAEIREAVDFLRYYAHQAAGDRHADQRVALGPVACISPWNFPLAIFIGQISAALAAGNVVLAKPAEQTPLIAHRAVQLMHQAGVPIAALQLLPGDGAAVGARLCADARIMGVVFTGSTEVAQTIHRVLAARSATQGDEIPLIAETGGQNALIADSSALPEQVVQDVLLSAFDSAGQRCSALRILCLQSEIADHTIAMLQGAMQRLQVGPTGRLGTDIGPVIDAEAKNGLVSYIDQAKTFAIDCYQLPLPAACDHGHFVPPTLLEIDRVDRLTREVFGPVLHVVRYQRCELPRLIDALNATGYGLTFGIHSRIDETIDEVVARMRAGNVYVNRNIVGAVVGVQPFGGEGKSGTGPKAGGPLYLWRLRQLDRFDAAMPPDLASAAAPKGDGAVLAALQEWAVAAGMQSLVQRLQTLAAASLAGRVMELPGPTGERNQLVFKPRGTILCSAGSGQALLDQIAATVASGNSVALLSTQLGLLPPDFPDAVRRGIRILTERDLTLADIRLALAAPSQAAALRQAFAGRDGAIVPVIAVPNGEVPPLWRLVGEQTLCTNTTASGGNASLMTLAV